MWSALQSALAKRTKESLDAEKFATRHGGLDYATSEASFEAKAPDQSRTGVGGRRVVFIANGGGICNDRWSGSRYADDSEQRTGS